MGLNTKKTKAEVTNKKKQVKTAKKLKKKVASTMDWSHVHYVGQDYIELKKGKKIEHVVGIKITPIAIHLYDYDEQARWIRNYRSTINRLDKYKLYYPYVYTPINYDEELRHLTEELATHEDSDQIRELYQCEIDKYRQFAAMNMELEFFVCVKGKPGEILEDQLSDVFREFKRAGFKVKILRRLDYDNLIAYYFNNKIVNDFYFSRGVFEALEYEQVETEELYANIEEDAEVYNSSYSV